MTMKPTVPKPAVTVMILILALLAALTGCAPAKKMLPGPSPRPNVSPDSSPFPNPAVITREKSGLNSKLSSAAKKIRDINGATIMVIGTSAYAGVKIDKNLKKARFEALKAELDTKIKSAEPLVQTIWVSADPATISKIDRVRAAIRAGKHPNTYASDLRSILNNCEMVR